MGDIREDGKIFRGYWSNKEHWTSPEKYFRYRISQAMTGAKTRAKANGLLFELSLEYLISIYPQNGKCPVLGMDMEFGGGNNEKDTSPSIDRINNNLGYTPGNVVWVSDRANRLKRDASLDELRKLLHFYDNIP